MDLHIKKRDDLNNELLSSAYNPVRGDKFEEEFMGIINSLPGILGNKRGLDMTETIEWLAAVMLYNVPHGKKIRGRLIESAYTKLVKIPSDQNLKLARVLGWCVEIACFLVADDIMDKGVTRRGQPCWYHVNNQGNIAFNDAFLLEHVALWLLREHFGNSDSYPELLNIFLDSTFKTMLGQSLNTRTCAEGSFTKFSTCLYNSIVIYKTSYYTIYLPLALAMIHAGISINADENLKLWRKVEDVAIKIGTLFQIQDDYMDCFVDDNVTGKVGTDIEEGKCTWLFLAAKASCNSEQFETLLRNYGSVEKENVKAVKEMYANLNLPRLYMECQKKILENINSDIDALDHSGLEAVLKDLVSGIVTRKY